MIDDKDVPQLPVVEMAALPFRKPLQDPQLRNGLAARRLQPQTELQATQTFNWRQIIGNPTDNQNLLAALQNLEPLLGFVPLNPGNNLSELTDLEEALINLGLTDGGINDIFLHTTGGELSGPLRINADQQIILVANEVASLGEGSFQFDGAQLFFTPSTVRKAVDLVSDVISTTVTVVNTTTETSLFSANITAGTFAIKQLFKIILAGRYSTANGTDQVTIKFKINGTTALSIVTAAGTVTNAPLFFSMHQTIRTLGASGTLWPYLEAVLNSIVTHVPGTAAKTIDTTADVTLSVTAKWSAADAGNTISIDQALLNAS